VGDHHEGDAGLVLDVGDLELRVFAQLLVEGAERFVQQQQLGLLGKRRASATRWRWPPESWCGLRSARCDNCTRSSISFTRSSRWPDVMASCFRP
jgi:hypothetical protein